MTYTELRAEIQAALDTNDYDAIIALITPENIDLVEVCAPGLIGDPPFIRQPSYLSPYQLYLALPGRLSDAGTVDGAISFFNSAYAGVAQFAEFNEGLVLSYDRLSTGNPSPRYAAIDAAHRNKIVEVC